MSPSLSVTRTAPFVEAMSGADEIPGYFGPHPLRIRYGPNEDDAEAFLMLAEDMAHELTHKFEAFQPEHEWPLIPTEAEEKWKRFLMAQIGLAKLRGFWGQLGNYLSYVKSRPRREALPLHEWVLIPTEPNWKRFLIAQIGLARLRGLWGQVGQYLKYVKWRTRAEALL